ncbi:MAG: cyclic nucleotide-binding/CBS domain-containing protein [Gemmatimonadales bacterium]|nr:MAG: cyclic nucleotide-binding/CBS domain-containing protein [Gemmatimonadales bacterium]
MEPELREIRDFLARHAPFDRLSDDGLEAAVRGLRVRYHRAGDTIFGVGAAPTHLFQVRSGAVELRDEREALVQRLGEGEVFGAPSLLSDSPTARSAHTVEDSLLYLLPAETFHRLRARELEFTAALSEGLAKRLGRALRSLQSEPAPVAPRTDLLAPCGDLIRRGPVTGEPEISIRDAAIRMSEAGVASLLIVSGSGGRPRDRREEPGEGGDEERPGRDRLVGIVTNRDLRTRVLAAGVSPETPVRHVMTPNPITLAPGATRLDAILAMVREGIHHIPLVDGDRVLGVVSATDLLREQALHPVFLGDRIRKAPTLLEAIRVARERERLFLSLIRGGLGPAEVERILTGVADALARRLLEVRDEGRLGAWLVFGSQARREMGLHSDQDHGLVLPSDDDRKAALPSGEDHAPGWAALGRRMARALTRAGYPPCPGKVMASEARWRQTLEGWDRTFQRWTMEPAMEELVHAGILFDLRGLGAGAGVAEQLRTQLLGHTKENEIFAAQMAAVAVRNPPPLGIFRRFVVERSGDEEPALEIKRRGIQPLVDLVRVHALVAGVPELGTRERLQRLAADGVISPAGAADLREALDFFSTLRQRHQARRLEGGRRPDSRVAPADLAPLERSHLKDAFQILRTQQEHLGRRYQTGRLGT